MEIIKWDEDHGAYVVIDIIDLDPEDEVPYLIPDEPLLPIPVEEPDYPSQESDSESSQSVSDEPDSMNVNLSEDSESDLSLDYVGGMGLLSLSDSGSLSCSSGSCSLSDDS